MRQRKRVRLGSSDGSDAADRAPVIPSQTHSLYSEELGSVPILGAHPVVLSEPAALQLSASQAVDEPEHESAPTVDARDERDDDDFEKQQSIPTIRLNPKAKKTGRPATDRKQREAATRQARATFSATQDYRRSNDEVTLTQLVASLNREQPSPSQTLARLAPVLTKFSTHTNKKPKFKVMLDPLLNAGAFYHLPPKLLNARVRALPVSNDRAAAISLVSQDDATSESKEESQTEVVVIGGVGTFSRKQIESMKRVENIHLACSECLVFCTWLQQDVATVVSDAKSVADMVVHVSTEYPDSVVHGFDNEYHYSMLYRLAPPLWFIDALLLAFCDRLVQAHSSVRVAGVVNGSLRKTRGLTHTSVATVLVPVNYGNQHWCGAIVSHEHKRVIYYDSMTSSSYTHSLDKIAWEIARLLISKYDVLYANPPLQFDGHSCSFFVCLKFWRHVDAKVSKDLSPSGATALRHELSKFVLCM